MSPQTIKIIITAVLLLHGVAHGRAFIALIGQAAGNNPPPVLPVRSWLLPKLSMEAAGMIALFFWLLATIGFIASAFSFWGTLFAQLDWRLLAILSAVISTAGTILFSGIWPGAPNRKLSTIDTVISLVVNVAVLIVLLGLNWPPYEMFGK
jgi:hypothetical protein